MKEWIIRRVVGLGLTIPAMGVNYLAVLVLITVFHFNGYYVFSAVLVGDIIGFMFNAASADWQVRFARKYFKSWRRLYEEEKNRNPVR